MAECESHGSRAGATARPHFGVDKLILRRPDEHCLRASDPVHEPAPPRSLSHRPRPPVDTLPGRNGRLVLTSRSLPPGCQVNYTCRTALVSINGEGARCVAVASRVRLSRPPRPTASGLPSPGAGRFGSSHADKSTARRVTASVVRRRAHQRDAHGLRRRHHPRWPEQSPRAPVTRGVSWVVELALRAGRQPEARRSPKRTRAEAWSSRPTIETRGASYSRVGSVSLCPSRDTPQRARTP